MRTKISNPALKQPFEKRLLRYSLAVGALAAAPAAHASPVWSGPRSTVVNTGNSPYAISLDGLGTDLTITMSYSSGGGTFSGSIAVAASAGDALEVGPLVFGTPINFGDPTATTSQTLWVYSSSGNSGAWLNHTDPAFLGVQFTSNAQQYLGWVELQLAPGTASVEGTATLLGYAYENQPQESINAGDTGAPEPCSLSLFALGAAGVLALRRRRRARNGSVRQA